MRVRVVITAVGAAGLAIASCSGGSPGDDGADTDNGSTTTKEGVDNAADDGSSDDDGSSRSDQPESPLSAYMPGMTFSSGGMMSSYAVSSGGSEMSEQERQDFRRMEEAIAECMRTEGFEYVPVSLDDVQSSPHEDAYALEPKDFAKEYGYGVSTLMFGPDEADEETTDPNSKIRDELSEAAQEEYDRALWGDLGGMAISDGEAAEDDVSEDGADGPGDELMTEPDDLGCQGQASTEIYGDQSTQVEDGNQFQPLFEDIFALQERIQNDPRVVAATEEWASCMADAGYPGYETPDDPQNEIFDEMLELQGHGEEGESETVIVGGPGGGPANADVDPEQLAEVQKREVKTATADYACQQEHYEDVHREVVFEMEQEFVDDNQAELERYRDWMAESGEIG